MTHNISICTYERKKSGLRCYTECTDRQSNAFRNAVLTERLTKVRHFELQISFVAGISHSDLK